MELNENILEKIRDARPSKTHGNIKVSIDEDDYGVVEMFFQGDIQLADIGRYLQMKDGKVSKYNIGSRPYIFIVRALVKGIREGKIKIMF